MPTSLLGNGGYGIAPYFGKCYYKNYLNFYYTVPAGFNEFSFSESSRFNSQVFDLKYFFPQNFWFKEYPGLTNNWLNPKWFIKSGEHYTQKSLLDRKKLC